jgi:hypothetical protein
MNSNGSVVVTLLETTSGTTVTDTLPKIYTKITDEQIEQCIKDAVDFDDVDRERYKIFNFGENDDLDE